MREMTKGHEEKFASSRIKPQIATKADAEATTRPTMRIDQASAPICA